MALQVELVSPERILYSGEAEMVLCRTSEGEIAFLTGHAPFVGALGIGAVTIQAPGGGGVRAAVHGGFVEVKDNRVSVLSDVAELSDQIDVGRARDAEARAEAAVRSDPSPEHEAALRRARVRVEVATGATAAH